MPLHCLLVSRTLTRVHANVLFRDGILEISAVNSTELNSKGTSTIMGRPKKQASKGLAETKGTAADNYKELLRPPRLDPAESSSNCKEV